LQVPVTITVNGQRHEHQVEPRLLLVHFLREVIGSTGTKIGCDTSQCGACTVLLDGVCRTRSGRNTGCSAASAHPA